MALKDWKRKKYSEEHILYEEKENPTDAVKWNKTLVVRHFGHIWTVDIGYVKSDHYIIQKHFKTKSQALKFAKDYMRRH